MSTAARGEDGFILPAVLWHMDKSHSIQHWLKEPLEMIPPEKMSSSTDRAEMQRNSSSSVLPA